MKIFKGVSIGIKIKKIALREGDVVSGVWIKKVWDYEVKINPSGVEQWFINGKKILSEGQVEEKPAELKPTIINQVQARPVKKVKPAPLNSQNKLF